MRNARTIPPQVEQRDRDDWRESALCLLHDPELFHPHKSADPAPGKDVCRRCPVTESCLNFALEVEDDWGIYGGTTPHERRKLLRKMRRAS